MKFDPNDPKLTAYVLGELDEQDRAAVEQLLAENADARREVEELKRATATLTTELAKEDCPALAPEQHRKILYEVVPQTEQTSTSSWSNFWLGIGFATAVLVLGAMLLPALNSAREKPRQSMTDSRLKYQQLTKNTSQEPQRAPTRLPDAKEINQPLHAMENVTSSGKVMISGERSQAAPIREEQGGNQLFLDGHVEFKQSLIKNFENRPQEAEGQMTTTLQPSTVAGVHGMSERPQAGPVISSFADSASVVSVPSTPTLGAASLSSRAYAFGNANGQAGEFARTEPQRRAGFKRLGEEAIDERNDLDRKGWSRQSDSSHYYPGTESYEPIIENPFLSVTQDPLSTFSLDVDTASYANIRRFINEGSLPPRDAIRVEEMINYFTYRYAPPRGGDPLAVYVEVADCPWNPQHRLARIGIKAKEVSATRRPALNLVFLIDVSGSMEPENKLPLVKRALWMLTKELSEDDRVSIVVYANNSSVVLNPTSGDNKETIFAAIEKLHAEGSTNGGEGIQTAYRLAQQHFRRGGVNRVILCTDGDFNVGIVDPDALIRLIQDKAKSGVFLSVLGFGMGNLKDATMVKLADKGNGNYAYVDSLDEARKVLVDQMVSTVVTVAKDVKAQIEFNPACAQAYRLIGYEKRNLDARDFNNDRKDAGDLGAGHAVTVLYEIIPASGAPAPEVDPLKYQARDNDEPVAGRGRPSGELFTLKIRYKQPDGDTSKLMTIPYTDRRHRWNEASEDFQFASAVAEFAMILRNSDFRNEANFNSVLQLAEAGKGFDDNGYRAEFITLVKKARATATR